MEKREPVTDPRRNRRVRVLLVAGLLILAVAGFLFVRRLPQLRRSNWNRSATGEDVLVLSMTLGKFFQENPQAKPEDVEAFMLQSASAAGCDLRVDPAGKPVDWFGTPFRVERTFVGKEWVVTVTSAGRDRLFGTPDDIQKTNGK